MAKHDAVDKKYGGDKQLRTAKKWKQVQDAWAKVADMAFTSPGDANREYLNLSTLMTSLIADEVGGFSNLTLDPNLDTYWLQDTAVGRLPSLAHTLAQSASVSLKPALDDEDDFERRLSLAGDFGHAATVIREIETNIAISIRETTNSQALNIKLDGPTKMGSGAVTGHNEIIKRAYMAAEEGASQQAIANQVVAQTLQSIDELYRLHAAITRTRESHHHSRQRIQEQAPRRYDARHRRHAAAPTCSRPSTSTCASRCRCSASSPLG